MNSPPPDEDLDLLLQVEEDEQETPEEEEEIPIEFEIEVNNNNNIKNNNNSSFKQTTLIPEFKQPTSSEYLASLNVNQKAAVTSLLAGGLQILAGPGSGKTKVLTTRVAYILQTYGILPEEMVVVTFTNKAANEMKARLAVLVGPFITEKLMMGTFHSVCVKYLRKYGRLLDLASNFIIADRNDCLAIIRRASKLQPKFAEFSKDLKPNYISNIISKCKSSNVSADQYLAEVQRKQMSPEAREKAYVLASIFLEYQLNLKNDNALDFDDLLIYGLDLVKRFPNVVSKVKTVLIDEFQDTNSIQYELVKCMAKSSKSLTIVGDPDQSVYGWRNAQVENLDKMIADFPGSVQIYLEENYRSTGAIIGSALAIITQDTKRIPKSLKPTHATGSSVVLHKAPSAPAEATFIAAQIKHLIVHSGGLLDFSDVAILLRYGALSRVIEVALQKAGIPSRMAGGNKFFERAEVKDILSYLQLVDNPAYSSALVRMINVPKRGIGDKAVQSILAAAKLNKISAFDVLVKSVNGSGLAGVAMNQRKAIRDFVSVIRDLRSAAEEGASVADLIDQLIKIIDYNAHLERTQGSADAKERYENILELKAYAVVVAEENPEGVDVASDVAEPILEESDDREEYEGEDIEGEVMKDIVMSSSQINATTSNPLRTFLAVSMLATDTEEPSKDDLKSKKVTLTTVHSAKGLEWPVVFIPGCEAGIYPSYRSSTDNEIDEERRLLYVAITRAKVFCTLSHSENRMVGAETKAKVLSPFLNKVAPKYPTLFVNTLQKITPASRIEIAKVLSRNNQVLDEVTVANNIAQHIASLRPDPPPYKPYTSQNGLRRYDSYGSSWSSQKIYGPASVPSGSGFSSALKTYQAVPPSVSQSVASTSKLPPLSSLPKDQPRLPFAPPRNFVAPSKIVKARPSTATTSTSVSTANVPIITPNLLPSKALPFKAPSFNKSSSTSSTIPMKTTTSGKGSLKLPETRQSLIDEAVLLNPVYKEPVDLLERFKQTEVELLKSMKGEGGKVESMDTSSDREIVPEPSRRTSERAGKASWKRLSQESTKLPAKRMKKSLLM